MLKPQAFEDDQKQAKGQAPVQPHRALPEEFCPAPGIAGEGWSSLTAEPQKDKMMTLSS